MSREQGPGPVVAVRPPGTEMRVVARNGVMASTQVVLTSLGYLLAYRVMSSTVGIEVIGAWSLCLALGSIAMLADLGISDGLARTVAQRAAAAYAPGLRQILRTGLVFCALGCIAGGVLCYLAVRALLPRLLPDPQSLTTTLAILAPALAVAGINTLALSCQGVLEGLEKYALRFAAGVAGVVVFVAAVLLVVPAAGLAGVVWAYLAQSLTLLAVSLTLCLRHTPADREAGRPRTEVLRELVSVGLPIRATGLTTVLLDPLTRVAVTWYGGMVSAGHYEVASRLVLQLRTIVVAGFQAGLPRLVKLRAQGSVRAAAVTANAYRAGLSIAVAAFTLAALLGPFVYQFVLGYVPPLGMQFFVLLCAGWCVNAVSAPFFFNLVARRRLTVLWLSSGVMGVANVALFAPLGGLLGATGVVAALALAIAAGSTVSIVAALRGERMARWVHAPELLLLIASGVAVSAFVRPGLHGEAQPLAAGPLLVASLAYSLLFLATLHVSGIFRR